MYTGASLFGVAGFNDPLGDLEISFAVGYIYDALFSRDTLQIYNCKKIDFIL